MIGRHPIQQKIRKEERSFSRSQLISFSKVDEIKSEGLVEKYMGSMHPDRYSQVPIRYCRPA